MAMLRKLLLILLLLVTLVVVVFFVRRNNEEIALDLVFWQSSDISFGAWMLLAFLLGSAGTYLLASMAHLKLKAHNTRLNRRVSRLESDLQRYKSETTEGAPTA